MHVHTECFEAETLENWIVDLRLPNHLKVVHKDKESADLQKLSLDLD